MKTNVLTSLEPNDAIMWRVSTLFWIPSSSNCFFVRFQEWYYGDDLNFNIILSFQFLFTNLVFYHVFSLFFLVYLSSNYHCCLYFGTKLQKSTLYFWHCHLYPPHLNSTAVCTVLRYLIAPLFFRSVFECSKNDEHNRYFNLITLDYRFCTDVFSQIFPILPGVCILTPR